MNDEMLERQKTGLDGKLRFAVTMIPDEMKHLRDYFFMFFTFDTIDSGYHNVRTVSPQNIS